MTSTQHAAKSTEFDRPSTPGYIPRHAWSEETAESIEHTDSDVLTAERSPRRSWRHRKSA